MKKIILLVLFLVVLGQGPAVANEWKIDAVHTGILFEIKHIYSITRGYFSAFSGDVFFDPNHLEKSRFDFTVKVDSIKTNNGKRDNHLRSDDFFAAGKYPVMTFKTSRVTPAGGNKYKLEGQMTIKDVTRDIVMEFTYWGQKAHPAKKKMLVAGFDARLTIDRLDYHVGGGKFYEMGVVGRDVDILITLEVFREK